MAEPSPALVRRAQAGDREALSALVQSQQTYVYSIAMSIMHTPADAADMTQEAFLRLLRPLGTYRGETRFTTWLYRQVTNICLDGLRRRGPPADAAKPGHRAGPGGADAGGLGLAGPGLAEYLHADGRRRAVRGRAGGKLA